MGFAASHNSVRGSEVVAETGDPVLHIQAVAAEAPTLAEDDAVGAPLFHLYAGSDRGGRVLGVEEAVFLQARHAIQKPPNKGGLVSFTYWCFRVRARHRACSFVPPVPYRDFSVQKTNDAKKFYYVALLRLMLILTKERHQSNS